MERAAKMRRTEGAKDVTKTHADFGTPFTDDYFPYTKGQIERVYAQRRYDDHKRAWNTYYQSNTINGYKDRHYILREFVELNAALEANAKKAEETTTDSTTTIATASTGTNTTNPPPLYWMEIGCGVGNAVMPAFKEHPSLHVCGFDISSVAINLFKKKALEEGLKDRVDVCVTNLAEEDVPSSFMRQGKEGGKRMLVDFASIIFVLSAVPQSKHRAFLKRARALMKTGAVLFFRDYFENDMAQKRFSKENKIDDTTFFRVDGTLSHFFSKVELDSLFTECGFELIEDKIVEREVENRKDEKVMQRRWYQARYRCV